MQDCRTWMQNDEALHRRMFKKIYADNIPISGSFALTHRCTLRCQHCYLGDQKEIREHADEELTCAEIERIIDQMIEAGAWALTITGGEPLLHTDFKSIYLYAIKKGLLVTVLTNGTLLNEDIIDLFRQYPPRCVEVSIYGATEEIYEKVTQTKGSFKRFIAGVKLLHSSNIRFSLKTMLLTLNHHELDMMNRLAQDFGVDFRYDPLVFPCVPNHDNGGKSNLEISPEAGSEFENSRHAPLMLRLDENEVIATDFSNEERGELWYTTKEYYDKHGIEHDVLLMCFAAKTGFHLDPYGGLQACLLLPLTRKDIRHSSFLEGWRKLVAWRKMLEPHPDFRCNTCKALCVCQGCPATFLLETGSMGLAPTQVCQTGIKRYEALQQMGT